VYDEFEPTAGTLRGHGFEAFIGATGYRYPDTSDPDDGNWVDGEINVAISGPVQFRAAAALSFWAPELEAFQRELAELHSSLSGEAVLTHMEGVVRLHVRLSRGRGTIAGFIRSPEGARLEFEDVPTDQSFLFDAVAGLGRITEAFPPRGLPA
jgi:hypothetical protein